MGWIKPKNHLSLYCPFNYGIRSQKFMWDPRSQLYSMAGTPIPPLTPHLGSYMRALLGRQDRRHLFVFPWFHRMSCFLDACEWFDIKYLRYIFLKFFIHEKRGKGWMGTYYCPNLIRKLPAMQIKNHDSKLMYKYLNVLAALRAPVFLALILTRKTGTAPPPPPAHYYDVRCL